MLSTAGPAALAAASSEMRWGKGNALYSPPRHVSLADVSTTAGWTTYGTTNSYVSPTIASYTSPSLHGDAALASRSLRPALYASSSTLPTHTLHTAYTAHIPHTCQTYHTPHIPHLTHTHERASQRPSPHAHKSHVQKSLSRVRDGVQHDGAVTPEQSFYENVWLPRLPRGQEPSTISWNVPANLTAAQTKDMLDLRAYPVYANKASEPNARLHRSNPGVEIGLQQINQLSQQSQMSEMHRMHGSALASQLQLALPPQQPPVAQVRSAPMIVYDVYDCRPALEPPPPAWTPIAFWFRSSE